MKPGFTLRDYQSSACRAVWKALHKPAAGMAEVFAAVLLLVATGGGKTIIAAALMEQFAIRFKRALFLADTDELCDQARKKLFNATGKIADLEKASSRAAAESDLVVGSIQTMSSLARLERFPPNHWQYVICDEAHGTAADNWQRLLKRYRAGGAQFIGLTATPGRGDGIDIMAGPDDGDAFRWEHVAYEIALKVLIDAKHLSPIRVASVPIAAALSGDAVEGDQVELGQQMMVYHNAIIDQLLPLWDKEDRKAVLIFHPSCESSEQFTQRLLERGIPAKHVEGASKDRKETLEGFDRGDFRVLNNAQLLMKGYDCSRIDSVVPLRRTKVRGTYLQMTGRGTRLFCPHGCAEWCDHEDRKKDMLLIDCLWQAMDHALMGPAFIHTDAPEQVERVRRALEDGETLDLGEVHERCMGERESQFIEALRRGAKGRAFMLDARALGAVFHQPELMDYQPAANWQKARATDKQLAALARFGVDPKSVQDKGHASALMDALTGRADEWKATVPQLIQLAQMGLSPSPDMQYSEASRLIAHAPK